MQVDQIDPAEGVEDGTDLFLRPVAFGERIHLPHLRNQPTTNTFAHNSGSMIYPLVRGRKLLLMNF
jgi:hypothetical protein